MKNMTKWISIGLLTLVYILSIHSCKTESPEVINPCDEIECKNGGECDNGYCKCLEGFSGEKCEIIDVPDPCEGIECQNGGECDNGECECPNGFSGKFCETPHNCIEELSVHTEVCGSGQPEEFVEMEKGALIQWIEVTNRNNDIDRIAIGGAMRNCDGTWGNTLEKIVGQANLSIDASIKVTGNYVITGIAFTVHKSKGELYLGASYRKINEHNQLEGPVNTIFSSNTPSNHQFELSCSLSHVNQQALVGVGMTEKNDDASLIYRRYIDLEK